MSTTITSMAAETARLGYGLAKHLKGGEVLALTGDLGGGKTTFLQGLARGLGIQETVNSPTFNIIKRYKLKDGRYFYHIDAYRLNSGQELLDLGFEEMINSKKNITAIEWADRVRKALPGKCIKIKFKYLGKDRREIKIKIYDA